MRIAHIVCTYPPYFGGMGNTVFETVQELIARGHDVDVFTPGYYEKKEMRPADAPPAKVHAPVLQEEIEHVKRIAPSMQYGNAARIPEVTHQLDAYDIVHLHYPFFGTANLVRKWKEKHPDRPLVITYHMDAQATGWKGLIFSLYAKFWMPKILAAADHVIGSTESFLQASQAGKYLTGKEAVSSIPFGVDAERFSPRPHSRVILKQFGIPEDANIVLLVGGMDAAHHFKGVSVLLKALSLLQSGKQCPHAIFVGDGELRAQYELQAQGMGLKDKTHFMGRVPDELLPEMYRIADVLVLAATSSAEAFGLVLLEAMASGTPTIASDLPGVREVCKSGNGQLFPVRDYHALAKEIQAFFALSKKERELREEIARTVAKKKYSWKEVAKAHEALYESLV